MLIKPNGFSSALYKESCIKTYSRLLHIISLSHTHTCECVCIHEWQGSHKETLPTRLNFKALFISLSLSLTHTHTHTHHHSFKLKRTFSFSISPFSLFWALLTKIQLLHLVYTHNLTK